MLDQQTAIYVLTAAVLLLAIGQLLSSLTVGNILNAGRPRDRLSTRIRNFCLAPFRRKCGAELQFHVSQRTAVDPKELAALCCAVNAFDKIERWFFCCTKKRCNSCPAIKALEKKGFLESVVEDGLFALSIAEMDHFHCGNRHRYVPGVYNLKPDATDEFIRRCLENQVELDARPTPDVVQNNVANGSPCCGEDTRQC